MALSGDSTLKEILDNDAARAILDKHVPGLSNHPQIDMGLSMSLKAVAGYAEAGISPQALQAIIDDLAKLGEGS